MMRSSFRMGFRCHRMLQNLRREVTKLLLVNLRVSYIEERSQSATLL